MRREHAGDSGLRGAWSDVKLLVVPVFDLGEETVEVRVVIMDLELVVPQLRRQTLNYAKLKGLSLTDEFQVLDIFLLLLDLEGSTGGGWLIEVLCRRETSQASAIDGGHDHRGTPRHNSLDIRRPVFLQCL